MLPWKLRKRQFLPVNQNLLSVHFSLAKFQLVSSNLSLAMIWQMTYNQKLPKLCSATLNNNNSFITLLSLLALLNTIQTVGLSHLGVVVTSGIRNVHNHTPCTTRTMTGMSVLHVLRL